MQKKEKEEQEIIYTEIMLLKRVSLQECGSKTVRNALFIRMLQPSAKETECDGLSTNHEV